MKHFFVEIRRTKKDDEGKEYESVSLQTYWNAPMSTSTRQLRHEKNVVFDEVAKMLSVEKREEETPQ